MTLGECSAYSSLQEDSKVKFTALGIYHTAWEIMWYKHQLAQMTASESLTQPAADSVHCRKRNRRGKAYTCKWCDVTAM